MRLVFRTDARPIPLLPASLAVCGALALAALPAGASAQEQSVASGTTVMAAQQAADLAAGEPSNVAATTDEAAGTDAASASATSAQVLNIPADDALSDVALHDQVLSRQRGGAAGMVMMVAATPQLMRGASVTLWDEIAPPSPLPVPIDAARAAQGNVANYQRK
ncbi:hypothetical protein J8I87_18755 [Paraburkholderia sp. LEh10]|uniref:hypothetical protein n=1 Tax=Paraburkholderia sp. LEh10 TaxID=2821353 RepID=UPI001AE12BCA|nr:hypothetical protein [Paraburkholderia sp. LEh10]MBP0591732.1 hypothetical protein [Paraburkholderia sp. LEh10]